MEPKSPESVPAASEYAPLPPEYVRENGNDNIAERVEISPQNNERTQERNGGVVSLQQPTPIQLPAPVPVQVNDPQNSDSASSNNPAVAADEDLIEKEWVDTAKKIIANTKENPYERERQVNKLQSDYLRKRYGKDLGSDS